MSKSKRYEKLMTFVGNVELFNVAAIPDQTPEDLSAKITELGLDL